MVSKRLGTAVGWAGGRLRIEADIFPEGDGSVWLADGNWCTASGSAESHGGCVPVWLALAGWPRAACMCLAGAWCPHVLADW